jgi:alkanesulfonate monooxygenase SsuD/methylene tetrahydromethanopterin reductase-like flavin-dependent oxidoreductase (luciferase family)
VDPDDPDRWYVSAAHGPRQAHGGGPARAGLYRWEGAGPWERIEEGLAVLRTLWTEGKVDFHGTYFDYDEISFHSGTEMAPLGPIQTPPPMWIVSNPRLIDESHDERMVRIMKRAASSR